MPAINKSCNPGVVYKRYVSDPDKGGSFVDLRNESTALLYDYVVNKRYFATHAACHWDFVFARLGLVG